MLWFSVLVLILLYLTWFSLGLIRTLQGTTPVQELMKIPSKFILQTRTEQDVYVLRTHYAGHRSAGHFGKNLLDFLMRF
jgi:hypothetical protein